MKLIVGLGNPGQEYDHTRHNLGFVFVDKLRDELSFPEFKLEKKFAAEISEGAAHEKKLLLVKPQTFMNLSGEAIQKIMAFYKLSPADLLIIHDDIDIPVGKYKIATDSSSAGHNGVQNIIDQLGTQTFQRLRIGIGETKEDDVPVCRLGVHDFVLGRITPDEQTRITAIEKAILEAIEQLI